MERLASLGVILLLIATGCGSSGDDDPPNNMSNNTVLADSLTVVSWGGLYEESQIKALHEPWTAQTGVSVNSVTYDGLLDDLRNEVASDQVEWDVLDMEVDEATIACEEGLIDPIDLSRLQAAPDGTPVVNDFYAGTLFECGVANIVWSNVVVYNTNLLTTAPTSIADFFDTAALPGKRGMRKNPRANFEMALIADGVAPADVYTVLATEEGVTRAFNQLDRIKNDIVWWSTSAESINIISDQTVSMGTTYNARAFDVIQREQPSLAVLWDGQVRELDLWVLPKGSSKRETAYSFLNLATSTENLAAQASYIAYGPPRLSSQALVGTHAASGVDMRPFIPTTPENLQNSLQLDTQFWRINSAEIVARFNDWLQAD